MSQPFSSSGPHQGPHTSESRAGVPRPPEASAAGPQPVLPPDDILQIDDDPDPGVLSPRLPATLVSWPDRSPAPHDTAPPAGPEDDILEIVPEPQDAMLEAVSQAEDEIPEAIPASELSADGPCPAPRLDRPPRGRRLVKNDLPAAASLTPQQRLLLLDV